MTHPTSIALVTGANQGIGYQVAKELALEGFVVYLGSRDLERGKKAALSLRGQIRPVQLDVTDESSINNAMGLIDGDCGRLDLLINNAAIARTKAFSGMPTEEYARKTRPSVIPLSEVRAIWETNVFGVIALTQTALPLLRRSASARIINVSSGVGSLTINSDPSSPFRKIFNPGYAASKTALNAITLSFAIELESENIRVNAVSPGYTKTNLTGYEGSDTVEEGAREIVRLARLSAQGETGTFSHATMGEIPW